jgi:hypothetical protein
MTTLIPFVERRSRARLRETPLRRRQGQVRSELLERRKIYDQGFNVAATLELNLDRFPSKPSMLTFLRTLLYNSEADDLASRQPDYVDALGRAVNVLESSPELIEAVATLRGYQAYMAGPETRAH